MIKELAIVALLLMVSTGAWASDPPKDDKAKKDEKRPWPPQKVPKVIDDSTPERVGRKSQEERGRAAADKKK